MVVGSHIYLDMLLNTEDALGHKLSLDPKVKQYQGASFFERHPLRVEC